MEDAAAEQGWSEADSRQFIEVGHIHTPGRPEIQETILELLPAARDEPFLVVELGVGSGWLAAAILEHFPAARLIGLDRSPAMLLETASRLTPFSGRSDLAHFRLEDRAWLAGIDAPVRCFVSSLVIHHLDGLGKQTLYRDLFDRLDAGGGVLIADLVAPCSERERRYMARQWDAAVERQSVALTGSDRIYQRFHQDHSNWYTYPDPMDMPSTVPEHLGWLAEAGFIGVNVFWERAGHAVYGGYKPA